MKYDKQLPKIDRDIYLEMIKYRRAEGSVYQRHFCRTFLQPFMGKPDEHGNYILHIPKIDGTTSNKAFMAHHDTVHCHDGLQQISVVDVDGDEFIFVPSTSKSNCLGADCTSGVWLILYMIQHNIPGTYIIHAGEEVGMVGATKIVKDSPKWLKDINIAISFDRKGEDSIITHQLGAETASQDFFRDLNMALGGGFKADPTGAYTDSEAYAYTISECTNLSVGYNLQHSNREIQNLSFLLRLGEKLVNADWDSVYSYRDASAYDKWSSVWENYYEGYGTTVVGRTSRVANGRNPTIMSMRDYYKSLEKEENSHFQPNYESLYVTPDQSIEEIIQEHPEKIATILKTYGLTREDIIRECGLWEDPYGY